MRALSGSLSGISGGSEYMFYLHETNFEGKKIINNHCQKVIIASYHCKFSASSLAMIIQFL